MKYEPLQAHSRDKEHFGSVSDSVQRKDQSFAEIFNKPSTDTISHLKRQKKGAYSIEETAPPIGISTDNNDSR